MRAESVTIDSAHHEATEQLTFRGNRSTCFPHRSVCKKAGGEMKVGEGKDLQL
jgi:hypothetical protein